MPPQVVKTSLAQKLGAKLLQAHEQHKAAPPPMPNGELPAGIENGVAELRGCGFTTIADGKTHAGAPLFQAYGIVLMPTHHDGVPISGQRTRIMETIADSPDSDGKRKTISDHIGWVYGQLKLLGVKTEMFDLKKNPSAIEDACAMLAKAKPKFRFRTWKGQKQTTGKFANQEPRIQHEWMGIVAFTNPAQGTNGTVAAAVKDSTDAVTEQIGEAGVVTEQEQLPFNEFENPGDTATETSGDVDLTALVEACGVDGDEGTTAQQTLRELANAAGVTDEQINDVQSWQEVVDLMAAATSGGDAAEPAGPKAGDTGKYEIPILDKGKPVMDKVTKRPKKKAVDVEVKEVNGDKSTYVLKNLEDGKSIYKDVPFDKLLPS